MYDSSLVDGLVSSACVRRWLLPSVAGNDHWFSLQLRGCCTVFAAIWSRALVLVASAHIYMLQQLCRLTESYGLLVHCVVTLDCVLAQDKEPAAEYT